MTEPERTTPTIEERVAAGAEWLDANAPGWVERIDLLRLRLLSECGCVLGQMFGNFSDAPLGGGDEEARDDRAHALGFLSAFNDTVEAEDADYAALDAEWRRLILARREASR